MRVLCVRNQMRRIHNRLLNLLIPWRTARRSWFLPQRQIYTIDGDETEEEINLRHFMDMCNAVKATNPVAPPTLLISCSTYEQHNEWIDKLDADVHPSPARRATARVCPNMSSCYVNSICTFAQKYTVQFIYIFG